jgi:tetratricopeptide (TPR) repeat protein
MESNQKAISPTAEGDYGAALAAASRAIGRRPGGARYFYTRGMVQITAGRNAHRPDRGPIREDTARAFFDEAIKDLTKATQLDRSYDSAWSQRGYANLQLQRFELALQDINEAIKLSESNHQSDYINRAYCLHQLRRHAEAEADTLHSRSSNFSVQRN